jgi:hypothetical protein
LRFEVSVSQLAKKTSRRALPGPRLTVPAPAADGILTAVSGACALMAARDWVLASFGWPGSRLDTSRASTWADWVTLS